MRAAGPLAAGILLAACMGQATQRSASAPPVPIIDAHTYVAIGASETVGIGAAHPESDGWASVFYRTALPQAAVFYNLGEVGVTTDQALQDQLPVALSLHPDVVTVWLNTNDIVHSVPVLTYQANLDRLLGALAQAGVAHLLVANTPVLAALPAYRACLPGAPTSGPACAFTAGPVPSPPAMEQLVDAYNTAVAAAVARAHAVLVDLDCQGPVAQEHPSWVSSDGFHPSTEGHAQIAQAFMAALRGTGCYRPA